MTGYNPVTVCGAKTRGGTPCKRPAGWGTDHAGEGKCKLHGGNGGRPVIHGRYSVKHRESLAAKVSAFMDDPAPGDLTAEVALLRALLQDYLDRFSGDIPLPFDDITRIVNLIESVGRMVERIARILNATALTQAEVQYLQARIADLIVKYIDDVDQQRAFLVELGQSISLSGGHRESGAVLGPGGDQ